MMHHGHITSDTISTERRGVAGSLISNSSRAAAFRARSIGRRTAILARPPVALAALRSAIVRIVGHPPVLLAPVGVALVLVHRHRRSSPLKGNMRSDPIHNSSHYCVNDKSPPGPPRHADSALPGQIGRAHV